MAISQRGTSFSAPNPAYTTDRWNYICWNGNTTVAQSTTAPSGFSHSLSQTVSSGGTPSSGQWQGVGQVIEAFNVTDLGWGTATAQTVTLSFWVRSSVTGTYNVSLSNINGVQNLASTSTYHYITTYVINAANTWEYKTVTIAGPTGGSWNTYGTGNGISIWFDLGSGTNYNSSSPNTWESGTTFRTSSAASQVAGVTGSTWYLTGVQLEKGSTATPFDWRPVGTEMVLCQRYYQAPCGTSTSSIGQGGIATFYAVSVSEAFSTLQFPVAMRVAPTVTFYNSGGTSGGAHGLASAGDITSVTLDRISAQGMGRLLKGSGFTTGYLYGIIYQANAEL